METETKMVACEVVSDEQKKRNRNKKENIVEKTDNRKKVEWHVQRFRWQN